MPPLKLDSFGGMIPAWSDRLLPDGQSALAINTYLLSGALTGWRQPKLLTPLKNGAANYVFRVPNKATNDTRITAPDSFWMEFADADTNTIRTPVADDSFDRYYFASPSQPPQYATYDMIVAGQNPWLLGVPGSGCAPGVVVSGDGGTVSVGNPSVTTGTTSDLIAANSIFLIPITPTSTITVQDVGFTPASTAVGLHFQAVVYTDLNGVPNQLLGTGNDMVGVTAGTATTSTIPNGVQLEPNFIYWVGIATDSDVSVNIASVDPGRGASLSNTYSN